MNDAVANDNTNTLPKWDPRSTLSFISQDALRLSSGFLRSKPEGWFPGFSAEWLTIMHSLSLDLKIKEVRPILPVDYANYVGFGASIDNEPVGLFFDYSSAQIFLDAVSPGAHDEARRVLAEYFARRIISTLISSWSMGDGVNAKFDRRIDPYKIRGVAAVRVSIDVMGRVASFQMLLGPRLVTQLDGLWRRQIASTQKVILPPQHSHIEIAELAVPTNVLNDYLQSGAVLDLETPITDSVLLRAQGKAWASGRLVNIDGKLGVELSLGPVSVPALPQGTTRLGFVLGTLNAESFGKDSAQSGIIVETDSAISNRVTLIINGEPVGNGNLHIYEGRFAVSVE